MTLSQKILVKSGNTCLETGYKIEVSEIMDVEKMPVLYQVNAIISHVLLHSIG